MPRQRPKVNVTLFPSSDGAGWGHRRLFRRAPGFTAVAIPTLAIGIGENSAILSIGHGGFANDVSLCQIQIGICGRPHSVNVNCMATPDGELFISCSVGAAKYWCSRVGEGHAGRLRLDGVVYPVLLNRELDPVALDRAWAARIRKLQVPSVQTQQPGSGGAPPPLDAPRPDSWWSCRVVSRTRPCATNARDIPHCLTAVAARRADERSQTTEAPTVSGSSGDRSGSNGGRRAAHHLRSQREGQATGRNVVFHGDLVRRLRAFDAETGEVLRETILGSQVTGYTVRYRAGGRQYLTVPVGGAAIFRLRNYAPELKAPLGSNMLVTFALPD